MDDDHEQEHPHQSTQPAHLGAHACDACIGHPVAVAQDLADQLVRRPGRRLDRIQQRCAGRRPHRRCRCWWFGHDHAKRKQHGHQPGFEQARLELADVQRRRQRVGAVQPAVAFGGGAEPDPGSEPQPDLRSHQLERPDLPDQHARHHFRRHRADECRWPACQHAGSDAERFSRRALQPQCGRPRGRHRQLRTDPGSERWFGQSGRRQRAE